MTVIPLSKIPNYLPGGGIGLRVCPVLSRFPEATLYLYTELGIM